MVEVFFRVLKSGCRVEDRRFEDMEPTAAVPGGLPDRGLAGAVPLPAGPELPGDQLRGGVRAGGVEVGVPWWCGEQPPPKVAPKLQEMIRLVAQLGGYVNRKREDEPGPQTVWLGLQRLHDIALCWEVFGPGAREKEAAVGTAAELV